MQHLFDDAMDLEDRPGCCDGLGLALARLMDDQRGALVEDSARGCVVLFGPGRQPVPRVDAPRVVALDDEGGLVPAQRSLERRDQTAEHAVGQREVVQIGAVAGLGVVAVDAAPDVGAVRNGEVEKDEVGLVGVQ